jgi:hypothetical protein
MATNPDFLKIVVKDVTLQWPRLDQPYRFDQARKETVACAPGAPNAGYSVAWECDMAEGKKFYQTVQAHYKDCQARNPKLPAFAKVFGMKKDAESGKVTFTAKKRAMNNDGKENKPPRVVDVTLKDLEDPRIWSGSKGGVRIFAFPATDPQTSEGGITLLLDAVVVTEAVYGGDTLADDFGDMATSTPSGFDDFDAPKTAATPVNRQVVAATEDSEVPF